MKRYALFLPVALLVWLTACSDNSTKSGCHIKGHTTFKEYKKAYLVAPSGNRIDSSLIENGEFHFEKIDSIAQPYVATIEMINPQDPSDQMDMPVAIENGDVRIILEQYIQTSGTPLNVRVQEFLNALQSCKDGVSTKEGIALNEVGNIFSRFYRQQILSNKDNAVGKYIYRNYGVHLNGADKELVKTEMGN